MIPLLVPMAISLLIESYASADGLCGKPCWAVLRNANSSFCSFCRSAEGCWPFPRMNFNIVAAAVDASGPALFYSSLPPSTLVRHVHIQTENSTTLLLLTLRFRFSTKTLRLLNCAIFFAPRSVRKATGRLMLRDEPRFICFSTLCFALPRLGGFFTIQHCVPRREPSRYLAHLLSPDGPLRKGVSLRCSINVYTRERRDSSSAQRSSPDWLWSIRLISALRWCW